MGIFTDTVTVYNKINDTEWKRTVVEEVQWADKADKQNSDGKLNVARYASVTFPEGTYERLTLNSYSEEDCIVYGAITDDVNGERGSRISDLIAKYPKSGRIKSVNDNSNRSFLKHIKVVVG